MAEIQEYLPQVSTPEGVGSVSPNLEESSAVGRAVENFGNKMEQGGSLIYRRQAQEESADVYSHMADLTSEMNARIQHGIQTGSLDQEQILSDYDQANEQFSNNINTGPAQNYMTRLQSRFRGHLMRTMSAGQAQIAQNDAVSGMIDARNKMGNSVFNDPSSFQDYYEAGLEDIDQRVKTGGLPEKMRAKAVQQLGDSFATQAVRGWANLNTDQARLLLNGDPTQNKPGAFDNFLSPDKKFQLNKEIDQRDRANEVEDRRKDKVMQDQQTAAAEKFSSDIFPQWLNNSLSTDTIAKAVKSGTLTAEQGEKWVNMINERQKQGKNNSAVFNNLGEQVVNGQITKIDDLQPYMNHGIDVQHYNSLVNMLAKTPEEKQQLQGEKDLFRSAQTIRYKNMMTGQYDLGGENNLAKFKADYAEAKNQVRQQGGNVGDLVNPKSPLYFGNMIPKYQTSMQDQLAHMNQDRTNKALGLPHDANPNMPPPANKNVRKPNESPEDFLKRIGG